MISLDEEFRELVKLMFDKLEQNKVNGKYSSSEYTDLLQMLENRVDTSNYGNVCTIHGQELECGWSPSMGYHCS